MGCVFETVNVYFGNKNHATNFINIFNEMLKDEIYEELTEDCVRVQDSGCSIYLNDTPIFKSIERGEQLNDVIVRFLKENPAAEFSADYYCAFSNCGDTTITTYEYAEGILTIDYRSGELPYESYCEECDYDSLETDDDDAEPIVRLEDWEEDKVYTCPNCGAVIEFDAYHCVNRIQIIE
jgi:hypothetical protein